MPHKTNKNKRKPRARRTRAQNPTTRITQNVHYPQPARQHHVKLSYSQRTTTATAKGTAGLVNFLNNTPLYMDAFYQIYQYSKILAVDVHIEIVNLDLVPYEFVLGTCQQGLISTITNDQAKQAPGAIVKVIGGSTGMSKTTFRKHYNVEQIVGYHLADRDTRMTFADANSSSYADSSLPAIYFIPYLLSGASTSGICITVVLTYHICFFDLSVPATSAVKLIPGKNGLWPPEPPEDMSIEQVEDESYSRDEKPRSTLNQKLSKPLDLASKPFLRK
jgi:hypothetical protein